MTRDLQEVRKNTGKSPTGVITATKGKEVVDGSFVHSYPYPQANDQIEIRRFN